MELTKYYTIRDFLFYYTAGIFWILDVVLIMQLLYGGLPAVQAPALLENEISATIITGILVLIIPHAIGFVMNRLCSRVTRWWRDRKGDPRLWVADYSTKMGNQHRGERLPKSAITRIFDVAPQVLGYDQRGLAKNSHLLFYQLRAYVVAQESMHKDLAIRAYDLMNLAESLVLPFPLFVIFMIALSLEIVGTNQVFLWIVSISLGMIALRLLLSRYYALRTSYVKHIYRAFLNLTASTKTDEIEPRLPNL